MNNPFRVVRRKVTDKMVQGAMPVVTMAIKAQGDRRLKRWLSMIDRPLSGDFSNEVLRFWSGNGLKAFKLDIVGERGPLVEGIVIWIETELIPHLCEKRLSEDDRENLDKVVRSFILKSWDARYWIAFEAIKGQIDKKS